MQNDPDTVLREILVWLEKAVIGLNLCPFARAVHARRQIHYVVSDATRIDDLLVDLENELVGLRDSDPQMRDTTLLIVPNSLHRFDAMLELLEDAERLLRRLKLTGEIQIASFHPEYQFAGTAPGDIENFTNCAPYPVLHLLREASVERAVAAFPNPQSIYGANIETMRALGHDGWRRLMRDELDGR